MGTRSITIVRDEDNNKIIEMYQQYDGYPSGVGIELKEFIDSGKMVNGISPNEKKRIFNGIGDFAAQLVAEFKIGSGGLYLYAPSDAIEPDEYSKMYLAEYLYEIDSNLNIKCYNTYSNKEVDIK